MMVENFKAFVVEASEGAVTTSYKTLSIDDLPEGDVIIKVHYSGINYKDALATTDHNGVIRKYPMVPGIDLAGVVVSSQSHAYEPGTPVIVTGYDLGVAHFGGFSEYARVPDTWVVPLPKDLTLEEAMIYGTAGYTAALAIQKLEDNGLSIENGPVLVRGATGGVGTHAVMMLKNIGYKVHASTGKPHAADTLYDLGAKEVIPRLSTGDDKPLGQRQWQAAIDTVGGPTVTEVLKQINHNGSVALLGNTNGLSFESSVFPFILRGVNLLGIDSTMTPMRARQRIWRRLSKDLKSDKLHDVKHVVSFDALQDTLTEVFNHTHIGRFIVKF